MRLTLLTGTASLFLRLTAAQCHTSTFTQVTSLGSGATASDGLTLVTSTVTETFCETTGASETETDHHDHTDALPASPTGSICSPHGDHWHCHASSTSVSGAVSTSSSAVTQASCEPHGDHWHCPSGVPEPTHEPDHDHPTAQATCEPHGDHWHCPSGVPEPTTAPSITTNTTTLQTSSSSTSSVAALNTATPSTVVVSGAGSNVFPFAAGIGAALAVYVVG